MSTPLAIHPYQIANTIGIGRTCFTNFSKVSRPIALPFVDLYSSKGRGKRFYHIAPVILWLRAACPERMTSEVEARLTKVAYDNASLFEEPAQ